MLDEKGSFYIIDAILAIILLVTVFLIVNSAISIETPDYSYESKDISMAQDTMEILSTKVNFQDQTFLGEISQILKENDNSKKSVNEVSKLCENKFAEYNLKNFKFTEINQLNGKVLASSGDYEKTSDIAVATRTYGDYSYVLSVW